MNAQALYELLPAVMRLRDQDLASRIPALLLPAEQVEYATLKVLLAPTPAERARLDVLEDKLTTGPLKALIKILGDPIDAFQENLDQLYDDLFIETCADWVVPYIGDLMAIARSTARGSRAASALKSRTQSRSAAAKAPRRCSNSSPATSPAGTRASSPTTGVS
jgi:hypothetical protein